MGQRLHLLGGIDVLAGILCQKMLFIAQVVEKRADSRQLPGPGGRRQPFVRTFTIVELGALPAQIGHVAVNIRHGDGFHKGKIYIHDVDLLQRPRPQGRVPDLLHVAEKVPQIQKILIHRAPAVGLDGLMIGQELRQYTGRLRAVINGHAITPNK